MKKLLLLSLLVLFGCSSPIGELSYFEYPKEVQFNKWIEVDTLYYSALKTREELDEWSLNDNGENFFENTAKKLKFNKITWADIVEYEVLYSEVINEVLNEDKSNFEEVNSIVNESYPLINKFIEELNDWE